jgi:hypothetical protein
MSEFKSLDRCAAYVAARTALTAVQRVAEGWPDELAERARSAAADTLHVTAEAISHGHASAGRRRCLRDALTSAIRVAASVDAARTLGFDDAGLDHAQRTAGRTVALLGMFLHANTAAIPEVTGAAGATRALRGPRAPGVSGGPGVL